MVIVAVLVPEVVGLKTIVSVAVLPGVTTFGEILTAYSVEVEETDEILRLLVPVF